MASAIAYPEIGNALKKYTEHAGEVFPGMLTYVTGSTIKQRLHSYYANSFADSPFLVVPKGGSYEDCWWGSKEEVLEDVKVVNSAFIFVGQMIPCVNLNRYVYFALQPVYDITNYDIKKKVSLADYTFTMSPEYIAAAIVGLDYCMSWVMSVNLLRRYIHALYPCMYKMKTTEEFFVNNKFWEEELGNTFRLVALPRTLNNTFTVQLLDYTDSKFPETMAEADRVQVDLHTYNKALYAVELFGHIFYSILERRPWTCAPAPIRDSVDSKDSAWVETEACRGRLSRAYFKLEEAFLTLSQHRATMQSVVESYGGVWGWWEQTPAAQEILAKRQIIGCDVGAAPGGWSYALAKRGAQVLSVDPGPLSIQHPNITYVPTLLQEGSVQALLTQNPLDILVCDMNCDIAGTTSLLMEHVVEKNHMKPGSLFIVTVKLFIQHSMDTEIDLALQKLGKYFDCIQTAWLFANKKERTILAIRNSTPIEQ